MSGGYGDNIFSNVAEGLVCAMGGGVLGAWTLAITGGSAAYKGDIIGIGGVLTALIGMAGGAVLGRIAGAIVAPFVGYEKGLDIASDMLHDLMQGLPGTR